MSLSFSMQKEKLCSLAPSTGMSAENSATCFVRPQVTRSVTFGWYFGGSGPCGRSRPSSFASFDTDYLFGNGTLIVPPCQASSFGTSLSRKLVRVQASLMAHAPQLPYHCGVFQTGSRFTNSACQWA